MTNAAVHSPAGLLGGKAEERLLTSFFVFYKTARIMEPGNAMFQTQARTFYDALQAVVSEQSDAVIKVIGGRFFLGSKLVRFDEQGQIGAAGVANEWRTMGIGGVAFEQSVTAEETRQFIRFIAALRPGSRSIEEIHADIRSQGWLNIRLLSIKEVEPDAAKLSEDNRKVIRNEARTHFFRAMDHVKEIVVSTMHDREISLAKTKRVVHSLIDHIMRDENSLVELAAIKDHDDYTYAHSTNVCVYSLTLGVRLGFDRPRLSQLGFSALFHDIGKVKLPRDLISKPDAFDENDWIQMQRHPLLGAKTILRNLRLDVHTARAARAAFEHHINNDFTGYPTLRLEKRRPNLFSRMIAIVDSFDALSSGRVYLKKPIPPDEVLKKMRSQMAVKFDRFLLDVFNDVIGIWPAGSLVLLTTNEIALVLTNNEQNKARPFVKIIGNRNGLLPEPEWADLNQPDHAHRDIVRMIDPKRYGLDIKDFILK